MKFEKSNCLICGSGENSHYLTVVNRFDFAEKFQLVRCRNCDFVFLNPRPKPEFMFRYYADERYQPHQLNKGSSFDRMYDVSRILNNRYKRYLIERFVAKGALLDFGCGSGEFLAEMRKNGWQVAGVEPAQKPRDQAKNKGLDVRGELEEAAGKFNVITMWHVLEHIPDVRQLIVQLQKRLDSSGVLIVAVPNLLSCDARTFGPNWVAMDAPRHLYHFRPEDMRKLFGKHAMRIIDYKTLYLDTFFNGLLSWQLEKSLTGSFFAANLKLVRAIFWSIMEETINRFCSSSLVYVIKPE